MPDALDEILDAPADEAPLPKRGGVDWDAFLDEKPANQPAAKPALDYDAFLDQKPTDRELTPPTDEGTNPTTAREGQPTLADFTPKELTGTLDQTAGIGAQSPPIQAGSLPQMRSAADIDRELTERGRQNDQLLEDYGEGVPPEAARRMLAGGLGDVGGNFATAMAALQRLSAPATGPSQMMDTDALGNTQPGSPPIQMEAPAPENPQDTFKREIAIEGFNNLAKKLPYILGLKHGEEESPDTQVGKWAGNTLSAVALPEAAAVTGPLAMREKVYNEAPKRSQGAAIPDPEAYARSKADAAGAGNVVSQVPLLAAGPIGNLGGRLAGREAGDLAKALTTLGTGTAAQLGGMQAGENVENYMTGRPLGFHVPTIPEIGTATVFSGLGLKHGMEKAPEKADISNALRPEGEKPTIPVGEKATTPEAAPQGPSGPEGSGAGSSVPVPTPESDFPARVQAFRDGKSSTLVVPKGEEVPGFVSRNDNFEVKETADGNKIVYPKGDEAAASAAEKGIEPAGREPQNPPTNEPAAETPFQPQGNTVGERIKEYEDWKAKQDAIRQAFNDNQENNGTPVPESRGQVLPGSGEADQSARGNDRLHPRSEDNTAQAGNRPGEGNAGGVQPSGSGSAGRVFLPGRTESGSVGGAGSSRGERFAEGDRIRREANANQGVHTIEVFHGTPNILEGNKFDLNKVGTGEGHASFGWGANLGTARGTGEHYRDTLSHAEERSAIEGRIEKLRSLGEHDPDNTLGWRDDLHIEEQSLARLGLARGISIGWKCRRIQTS